jgi:hypothetical protein
MRAFETESTRRLASLTRSGQLETCRAVADKDDIEQVGWDDLVVFSVNHDCVKQRITPFEVCRHIRTAYSRRPVPPDLQSDMRLWGLRSGHSSVI